MQQIIFETLPRANKTVFKVACDFKHRGFVEKRNWIKIKTALTWLSMELLVKLVKEGLCACTD